MEKNPFTENRKSVLDNLDTILSFLDDIGISSTLFVTGKMVNAYPEYFSKIDSRHEIACHGYDHRDLTMLTVKDIEEQVKKATDVLSTIKKPVGFRAPRVSINEETWEILEKFDYLYDSSLSIVNKKKCSREKLHQIRPIPNYLVKVPMGKYIFRDISPVNGFWEPYKCFFIHPWEMNTVSKIFLTKNPKELIKPYNYLFNGKGFEKRIFSLLEYLSENGEFLTCKDFVMRSQRLNED